MKKIIKDKEPIKATKKFTDREQPRKVFWDEYTKMEANLKNLEDIFVISYYGVGGIGKSSLLRKLGTEMNEKNVAYILYDFETAQDYKTVLFFIKNQLEQKYNFEFPLFDIALYIYSKNIGDIYNKKDIESLTEKSRIISLITETLGAIPGASIVASIFKSADLALAIFKNKKQENKNKSDLIKLQCETTEEILKNLPYYFSKDLANNLEEFNHPLVILLDTYEKLVNEIKSDGFTLMNDMWLRDDKGPILQVPGVLWVIAGREKLKWGDHDKDWEETLNQHILGDLSFQDANNFLQEAGIVEENLRKELYELTNGTPIYLDICVDTYEILKNNDEKITIDKFGKNVDVLIERFIKYMDIQSSELTYILSIIGNWTDDLIEKIGYKILPNFSITLYENLKKLSFVFYENEKYYIHKTVRDICQTNSPKLIKEKTLKELLNYYWEKIIETTPLNNNFLDYCIKYVDYILLTVNKENIANKTENLSYIIEKLENTKNYYGAKLIFDKCYLFLKENFPKNTKQFLLDIHNAILLAKTGFTKDLYDVYNDPIKKIVKYKYWDPILFQEISTSLLDLNIGDIYNMSKVLYKFIDTYDENIIGELNIKSNEDLSIIKNTKVILAQMFDSNLALELAKKELANCNNDKDKIFWLNKIIESIEEDDEPYIDNLECIIENNQITNNENEDLFPSYFKLMYYYIDKNEFSKVQKYMDRIESIFEKDNRVDLVNEYKFIWLKFNFLEKTNAKSLKDYSIEKIEYLKKKYAENIYTEDLILHLSKFISQEKCDQYFEYLLKRFFMDKTYLQDTRELFHYYVEDCNSEDNAFELYKKAYEEYAKLHSESIGEILNSLNDFAEQAGRIPTYENFLEYQLKFYELSYNEHIKIYGENDLKTLDVLKSIAYIYFSLKDYNTGINIYEKIYNEYVKICGENSDSVLEILNSLELHMDKVYMYNLDASKYLKTYQMIYDGYLRFYGENHPKTLKMLEHIASLCKDNKQLLEIHQKIYNEYVKIYGENDKKTIDVLEKISDNYSSLCDYEKALDFCQKHYDGYVRIYGKNNDETISKLKHVALHYTFIGNYEKALELYQEVYNQYKKNNTMRGTLSRVQRDILKIAFHYYKIKDYEKALDVSQKVYDEFLKMWGKYNANTTAALTQIDIIKEAIKNNQ